MSVPNKYTTWGDLLYEGKNYGVLYGFHIHQEIWSKMERYKGETGCLKSTAPWATIKVTWSIEEDKLYLTKLCSNGLLKELVGSEKILADWVDKLELLVKNRRVCKTYEKRNSYINEIKTLHLTFDKGNLVNMLENTELCKSIELRNYLDDEAKDYCFSPLATLRMDSVTLIDYLKGNIIDLIFPSVANFIDSITENKDVVVIALSIEDVKDVLKNSEVAVMASVQGKEVEKMVSSVVYSLTEGVLQPKGCLVRLTMNNEQYPLNIVEDLITNLGSKLGFDEEEADEYPFIIGAKTDNTMKSDDIKIEVLVGI